MAVRRIRPPSPRLVYVDARRRSKCKCGRLKAPTGSEKLFSWTVRKFLSRDGERERGTMKKNTTAKLIPPGLQKRVSVGASTEKCRRRIENHLYSHNARKAETVVSKGGQWSACIWTEGRIGKGETTIDRIKSGLCTHCERS